MTSKEVLTLQFGNYSNHIGTHFWNQQYDTLRSNEKINADSGYHKLFREVSDKHQPLVPRMISFDVKSKLNALKLDGTFELRERTQNGSYESSMDLDTNGDCVTYMQTEIEKNDFLLHHHSKESYKEDDFDLDDKVSSWSDYMSYKLDENSLQVLKNRFEDDSKFSFHGLGYSEFESIKDDVEDKLHYWIEECNSLDGFMIFTDIHDGFCGMTSKVIEELQDDYKSKTFLPYINCVSSENPADPFYWLNIALSFQSFQKYSSMFVLQSLKNELISKLSNDVMISNISFKADLPYHTSAILGCAIKSSILPWSMSNGSEMLQVCQNVTQGKWKLSGNAIGFPLAKDSDDMTFFWRFLYRKEFYGDSLTSLFPIGTKSFKSPLSQLLIFQDKCGLVVPKFEPKMLKSLGLNYDVFCNNPQKFLEFYSERWYPTDQTVTNVLYTKERSKFSRPISSLLESDSNDNTCVFSSLFTSSSFHNVLSEIVSIIQGMNLNKLHMAQEYGFDYDSRKELLEDLFHLTEEYNLDNPYKESYE